MRKLITCGGMRRQSALDPDTRIIPPPEAYILDFRSWFHDVCVRMRNMEIEFDISSQHSEPGSYASVDVDYEYRRADVRFSADFHLVPLKKQTAVVVHENLHVTVKPMLVPWETLESVLSQDAWTVTEINAVKAEENTVTSLERIITPNMSDPPDYRQYMKRKIKKRS